MLVFQQTAKKLTRAGDGMRLFTGVRYALRSWRHAKGFAAIAILTMTLGIGATTALFSVVDAVYASGAPPVAVLSFKLWKRDFAGDPKIVARRVLMDGMDYAVIGVMSAEFQFPHPAFLLWTPWRLSPNEIAGRRAHSYRLVA